jgi:4-hydroxy-3-methylbut-2-enyl diphosphate reductase
MHAIVSAYSSNGRPVILAGEKDHPEVQGTSGHCSGAVYVIRNDEDAERLPLLDEALLIAQTTFSAALFERLKDRVARKTAKLTVCNTLCKSVRDRMIGAAQLAAESDKMIVIGGKNSANTGRLYETCLAYCKQTQWVETAADIPPHFADIRRERVGITAGASTPDKSLKEVVTFMIDMENDQVNAEREVKDDFMADVEATLVKIRPGQTLTGKVVQITDDEVCVNIGYKSDGLISKADLTDENVHLEDEIEVEVVKVNDGEGNVILSQRNIVNRKLWAEIMQKFEDNAFVEGVGKEAVKGGLIADVEGISCFVPASHLSQRYVEKISDFIGQKLKLKIIEADQQKKRIVASRKAVIAEEAAARKAEIWDKLTEGEVIKGIVRRLTDFGAFVDIGGVDGLVHITDLSYGRIKHPSEVVTPDQEIEVRIINLDRERERIQLGYKQLQPKPWDVAHDKYPEGTIVTGKVVRITTFGAFVELEPGLDGLVHISQCALKRIQKVEDILKVGDTVRVKVLSVDADKRRVSLSVREALEDEMQEGSATEATPVPVAVIEDEQAAQEASVAEETPVLTMGEASTTDDDTVIEEVHTPAGLDETQNT